ncbi:MAG: hypothetical protein IJS94_09180 [Clostridia bacterium]|nr:hypothetical protein [Clostridia bacterium]
MVKKYSVFVLCAALSLMLFSPFFANEVKASGSLNEKKGTVEINGTFRYLSSYLLGTGRDAEAKYTYKDSFFEGDSRVYNGELAQMSLCMAMSAFRSAGGDPAKNVKDLFDGIGLDYKPDASGAETVYYPSPEKDSIGFAIGRKTIGSGSDGFTLVAVAVRGAGYGKEWAGNAGLGDGDVHQGFEKAAKTVYSALAGYISESGIKGRIKLWLAGYSRAAAVCNIAGALLNSEPVSGIAQNDIYVYCFECPNTTLNAGETDNGNIFCIINDYDIVTKVPFDGWGYTRYGRTYHLPSVKNTNSYFQKKNAMLQTYKDLLDGSGISAAPVYDGSGDLYACDLDSLFDGICKTFGRDEYVRSFQDDIEKIVSKAVGMISAGGISGSDALSLTADLLHSKLAKLTVSMGDDGIVFTVGESFFAVPVRYVPDEITETLSSGQKELGLISLATAAMTSSLRPLKNIFSFHYPELCLSWMISSGESLDEINNDDASAEYIYVSIECQSDVGLYDQAGKLADNAALFDDGSGKKTAVIPAGSDSELKIRASDEETITYLRKNIRYENGEATVTRAAYYDDIRLSPGDVLTGYAGEGKNGDTLLINGNKEITPDHAGGEKETGDKTLEIESTDGGKAYGAGTFAFGSYAKAVAAEDDGYTFAGWYENDKPVSGEKIFEFFVVGDMSLKAVFIKEQKDNVTGTTEGGAAMTDTTLSEAVADSASGAEETTLSHGTTGTSGLQDQNASLTETQAQEAGGGNTEKYVAIASATGVILIAVFVFLRKRRKR